jgi:hypothetical protein
MVVNGAVFLGIGVLDSISNGLILFYINLKINVEKISPVSLLISEIQD